VRVCPSCRQTKSADSFHFRNKQLGTRQHICGDCFTAYRREHYQRNRRSYIERNARLLRDRRIEWQRRLWQYLIEHPCVDCGQKDPLVLEFDHIQPTTKRLAVSQMVQRGFAWPTVLEELGKCEVRCANCHRRRTAWQFDWPQAKQSRGTHRRSDRKAPQSS
jgi:hypothetical protein